MSDPTARVVERVPLDTLWGDRGPLALARVAELAEPETEALVASRATRVAIAVPGAPLRWLTMEEKAAFWATRGAGWRASEWRSDCGPAVLLLERDA